MSYWLTTHYPHRSPAHPWNIYLKEKYREKAGSIQMGDRVAFYEYKGKLGSGRQAIIGVAEVTGPARANVHHEKTEDSGEEVWTVEIPCGGHDFTRHLRHAELCGLLGYSPSNRMRIPGGIMPLDKAKHAAVIKALWRSPIGIALT